MRRTTFLLLISLIICWKGYSQSNIRINNYWDNTYYINPASIFTEYQYAVSVAGRKQWLEFPGAPQTSYATFTARLYTNRIKHSPIGQIGFKIYHDKIGYTSTITLSPSYAYWVRLSYRWLMSLGLAYKIRNVNYNFSKANTGTTVGDPTLYENETSWGGNNADIGVEFIGNSILIGASSQNLFSLLSDKDANDYQSNVSFIYTMYRVEIDMYFELFLGVCAIKNESLYQAELKASVNYHTRRFRGLGAGIFFRTKKDFGIMGEILLSKSLKLACSYNYNVSGVRHSSYGTPEILLVWKFGKIKNCGCEEFYK